MIGRHEINYGVRLVEAREISVVRYRRDDEAGVDIPTDTPGFHLVYEGPLRGILDLAHAHGREYRGGRIELVVHAPDARAYVFRVRFDPARVDQKLLRALVPYLLDQGFDRIGLVPDSPELVFVGSGMEALDTSARALAKWPAGLGLDAGAHRAWVVPVGEEGPTRVVFGDRLEVVRAEFFISPDHR